MYAARRAATWSTLVAALAAAVIVALIGLMLIFGLRAGWAARVSSALIAVEFVPPVPERRPPPPPPPSDNAHGARDAPSPANLKNKATAVFAPLLPLPPLIVPPPVITAPLPASGDAAESGAADRRGPGTGAGGVGDGTGGGGDGGEGGGGMAVTPPRQIRGKLSFTDLPEGLLAPGSEGGVGVRYRVEPDGRVSDCRIERSSGFAVLDALACRLIEERFRFRPARDRQGRAVSARIVETHAWVIPPLSGDDGRGP